MRRRNVQKSLKNKGFMTRRHFVKGEIVNLCEPLSNGYQQASKANVYRALRGVVAKSRNKIGGFAMGCLGGSIVTGRRQRDIFRNIQIASSRGRQ